MQTYGDAWKWIPPLPLIPKHHHRLPLLTLDAAAAADSRCGYTPRVFNAQIYTFSRRLFFSLPRPPPPPPPSVPESRPEKCFYLFQIKYSCLQMLSDL